VDGGEDDDADELEDLRACDGEPPVLRPANVEKLGLAEDAKRAGHDPSNSFAGTAKAVEICE
jgi:hypothetical protein